MSWGAVKGRRFILPSGTEEDAVDDFAAGVNARKVHEVTASPVLGLTREVTWDVAPGYHLHYGRETPSQLSFVQISGERPDEIENFSRIIVEYLSALTDDELLAAVDSARSVDSRRIALVQAGLGAPVEPDDRYVERIRAALSDPDPRIREAGLWAAVYAYWPVFLPMLERVAEADESDLLRRQAQAAVDGMWRAGYGHSNTGGISEP